jgi:MmyB-like transcription regulator ligand binding domain
LTARDDERTAYTVATSAAYSDVEGVEDGEGFFLELGAPHHFVMDDRGVLDQDVDAVLAFDSLEQRFDPACVRAFMSRCSEDSQESPGYFDKTSACREGLLIFAAKAHFTPGANLWLRHLVWACVGFREVSSTPRSPRRADLRRGDTDVSQRSFAGVQVVLEEGGQCVEGDEVHAVVEVDVAGTGNEHQLLGFGGELVGLLAELAGVRLVTGDEQHRARTDRLDVFERVEVTRSVEFRRRWGAHDVRTHGAGAKTFHHDVVGDLELSYESVDMISDPGLTLTLYVAEPASPTAHALDLLASWTAEQLPEPATGDHSEHLTCDTCGRPLWFTAPS